MGRSIVKNMGVPNRTLLMSPITNHRPRSFKRDRSDSRLRRSRSVLEVKPNRMKRIAGYSGRRISELLHQADDSKECHIHSDVISQCPFQDRSGLIKKE